MTDDFKTYSMKVDELRLRVIAGAEAITPAADYDGTYIGVMDKQFFMQMKSPKEPNEFFEMRWRIIEKFPKFKNVHLIVGVEHRTLAVDDVPLSDEIVESKREAIDEILATWDEIHVLRNS